MKIKKNNPKVTIRMTLRQHVLLSHMLWKYDWTSVPDAYSNAAADFCHEDASVHQDLDNARLEVRHE